MPHIGKSVTRIDVRKGNRSSALSGDINLSDQVFMKILFAVDLMRSLKLLIHQKRKPWKVFCRFYCQRCPCQRIWIGGARSARVMRSGSEKPFTDRVRYAGDNVALVIAETQKSPIGFRKIKVTYQDLPPSAPFQRSKTCCASPS